MTFKTPMDSRHKQSRMDMAQASFQGCQRAESASLIGHTPPTNKNKHFRLNCLDLSVLRRDELFKREISGIHTYYELAQMDAFWTAHPYIMLGPSLDIIHYLPQI